MVSYGTSRRSTAVKVRLREASETSVSHENQAGRVNCNRQKAGMDEIAQPGKQSAFKTFPLQTPAINGTKRAAIRAPRRCRQADQR